MQRKWPDIWTVVQAFSMTTPIHSGNGSLLISLTDGAGKSNIQLLKSGSQYTSHHTELNPDPVAATWQWSFDAAHHCVAHTANQCTYVIGNMVSLKLCPSRQYFLGYLISQSHFPRILCPQGHQFLGTIVLILEKRPLQKQDFLGNYVPRKRKPW